MSRAGPTTSGIDWLPRYWGRIVLRRQVVNGRTVRGSRRPRSLASPDDASYHNRGRLLTRPRVFAVGPSIATTRWSQRSPMLARACWLDGRLGTPRSRWYGRLAARQLGSADAEVLRAEGFRRSRPCRPRLFRNTDGVAGTTGRGSGIQARRPPVPVDVGRWQAGPADQPTLAAELARRIPSANLLDDLAVATRSPAFPRDLRPAGQQRPLPARPNHPVARRRSAPSSAPAGTTG